MALQRRVRFSAFEDGRVREILCPYVFWTRSICRTEDLWTCSMLRCRDFWARSVYDCKDRWACSIWRSHDRVPSRAPARSECICAPKYTQTIPAYLEWTGSPDEHGQHMLVYMIGKFSCNMWGARRVMWHHRLEISFTHFEILKTTFSFSDINFLLQMISFSHLLLLRDLSL